MKKYSLLSILLFVVLGLSAQNIRYVRMASAPEDQHPGRYANDGLSWDSPKSNIQDAINDLIENGLDGEVWVAAGTYTPTESTESAGGSTLYMSFKIPAGITVRGGFKPNLNEDYDGIDDNTTRPRHDFNSIGWFYQHHTILSGDLSATKAEFAWDSKKNVWDPTFYGNSYHVVWFAMNGFDANGRANGLAKSAMVEGCVIEDGHAYNNSLNERKHNAYGGGAYMVANSTMQNCYFRNCDASRDGGAVYMDGGGMLIHAYVSDSQALGVGVEFGYGGGVCMEGSDKPGTHPIIVTGSGITNCVGRMGGGIATKVNKNCLNWRDNVAINATLINNNTATTEGGGVYMLNGGAMANATIVNNKCNGTGVTSNGMVTGRAGGVYCRDNASIANSVIWGNVCNANHDVQYATSRSSGSNDLKPTFYYNAVSKNDLTDWSGTTKKGVKSLADSNTGTVDERNSVGFPIFITPTTEQGAGHFVTINEHDDDYDLDHDGNKNKVVPNISMGMANLIKYSWKTSAESALHHAGINTYDITKTLPDRGSLVPEVSTDIVGKQFNPRSTLGGYTSEEVHIGFQKDGSTANFYVDPEKRFGEHVDHSKGGSWTYPTRFLANVFEYIEAERAKPSSGALNGITEINVFVKEGTVDNTDSYRTGRVREMAIDIPDNVKIYGSFPANMEGTDHDLSKRNPVLTPTIISGKLQDNYKYYVAHLINIDGKQNITIDGFKLTFANAVDTDLEQNPVQDGAAITLKNSGKTETIIFKNLTISNCQALRGPAIYADDSKASFENCIIHNNTAYTAKGNEGTPLPITSTRYADRGLVYTANSSNLSFWHCNVLRNVGYASYLDGTSKNFWNNSMFYGNLDRVEDNTNNCETYAIVAFSGAGAKALAGEVGLSGINNMFDDKTHNADGKTKFGDVCADVTGAAEYNTNSLNYTYQSGTPNGYPRMVNPTKNAGVSEYGDITYYGRATSFEPHNDNPVVNVGAIYHDHLSIVSDTSWGTDITNHNRDFGGMPDIGAVESRMATTSELNTDENANRDGQLEYGKIVYVRDYSDPATAIDTYDYNGAGNYTKNAEGKGIYDANHNLLDGSSWLRAINGNADYPSRNITVSGGSTTLNGYKIKASDGTYLHWNGSSWDFTTEANASVFDISGTSAANPTVGNGEHQLNIRTTNTYLSVQRNTFILTWYTISQSKADLGFQANASGKFLLKHPNYNQYIAKSEGTLGISTSNNDNNRWEIIPLLNIASGGNTNLTVTGQKGLNYAVELANKSLNLQDATREGKNYHDLRSGTTDATVYVGAGTYTDETGFKVLDHVKVYGAFPKTGNPGLDQRHPQLTRDVTPRDAVNVADYETILQTHASKGQTTNNTSVLSQPIECRVTTADDSNDENTSRFTYEGCEWDGFTIQNGYKLGIPKGGGNGRRNGGAGVCVWENVTIRNCVVRDNVLGGDQNYGRGGGVYCDGSTFENCYILNNESACVNTTGAWFWTREGAENYGGGVYMIRGTLFNSVIAGNNIDKGGQGCGIFIESANFYNNTIVNNTGCNSIGLWTSSMGEEARLTVYNSIIIAPSGQSVLYRSSNETPATFQNCYLQQSTALDATSSYLIRNNCKVGPTNYSASPFAKAYSTAVAEYDFRITSRDKAAEINCVNQGTDALGNNSAGEKIVLPEDDMDYDDRVQDCTVDIGAYEYNGSYDITPDLTTVPGQAIFYVTPNGRGVASGHDPANAACASKLQKVIDAAGRYKYSIAGTVNDKQVIVKVANSKTLEDAHTPFLYYATRTTDQTSTDTRMWSIIIPRGVEVWGGYTDTYISDADNGFKTRDVVNNPVYFNSSFYNKDAKINAYTYHIVTFTDHLFDANGDPYLADDETKLQSNQSGTWKSRDTSGSLDESSYLLMSNKLSGNSTDIGTAVAPNYISNRAVLDGIYVSGGMADGKDFSGDNANKNVNGYGGAAIVTDYAHVRNCIFTGNRATYGGALALKNEALVSGCLFVENDADKHGGALYVFEEGDMLSDGTTINSGTDSQSPSGRALGTMDQKMAHVFTSTLVGNHAMQGGGVWFSEKGETPNVRINSTVIWKNSADDQANVCGNVAPVKPEDDQHSSLEFYPFAYSAVQNLRMSGMNNMSVDVKNKKGTRFANASTDKATVEFANRVIANDEETNISPYYGLTDYSVLVNRGMPVSNYTELMQRMAVAAADFTGFNITDFEDRNYIEIGARVYNKVLTEGPLMLRLFVAQPDDINVEAAEAMMHSDNEYYSQEGSSFAYPFQSLQDALDYIYKARSWKDKADHSKGLLYAHSNNLPFEIIMSGGSFYPTRDLSGHYGQSLANTFAIPEGVSIYGGFGVDDKYDTEHSTTNDFYGAYWKPKEDSELVTYETGTNVEMGGYPLGTSWGFISKNVQSFVDPDDASTKKVKIDGYTIHHVITDEMLAARKRFDANNNNIEEPWEFQNQTVLSGDAANVEHTGVYHVMSAVADENVVGMLPKPSFSDADQMVAGKRGAYSPTGYMDYEEGQTIHLNGLIITGGYAHGYVDGALDDYSSYGYYHGGGLYVDGNRYCDNYNVGDAGNMTYKHTGVSNAVGYRDIPFSISNCKFVDNVAGYGGAISSNGTLDIFQSTFEANRAMAGTETIVSDGLHNGLSVQYPGEGGAIYGTHQMSFFNTMFANNEAINASHSIEPATYKTLRNQNPSTKILGGCGGAVYCGLDAYFHIVNCNFVNNQANMYPAVFTMNPNKDMSGIEMDMPNAILGWPFFQPFAYNQFNNTLFWGNKVNSAMPKTNPRFNFASKLICNFGLPTRSVAYGSAASATDANGFWGENCAPKDQSELDDMQKFEETAWFCAYEPGTGITAVNNKDMRDIDYKPYLHGKFQVTNYCVDCHGFVKDGTLYLSNKTTGTCPHYNSTKKIVNEYQNCNIPIDSDNELLSGPNFVNPSRSAGYAGYNESADWGPARLNNLTDMGCGKIKQTITQSVDANMQPVYTCSFDTYLTEGDIPADRVSDGVADPSDIFTFTYPYSQEKVGDVISSGAYTMTHFVKSYPEYKTNMALGEEFYMRSSYADEDGNQQELLRISFDPNPTHNQTYIDIGVYEYPHTPLNYTTEGDEVDVIWVSSAEKPDNGLPDGSDWTQPTSDLQRAIETLLASRNGHRKEIRLMNGTYSPMYTFQEGDDYYTGFYINTKELNGSVTLPDLDAGNVQKRYVKSFTIKGGYSRDLNNQYDIDEYPAIFRGLKRNDGTSERWNHLLYIKDATQRYGVGAGDGAYTEANKYGAQPAGVGEIKSIPIELNGITFINDQALAGTKGAAICYADADATNGYPETSSATPANISTSNDGVKRLYYTDAEMKTPSLYNAATSYYKDVPVHEWVENDDPNKLIISNCTILGSGAGTEAGLTETNYNLSSAVYISENGGKSLLYNNVFHSNYGNPLVATNATTINNTFALNEGWVDLAGANSSIRNSVLWKNNGSGRAASSSQNLQFKLNGVTDWNSAKGANFQYNAFTGGNTEATDYKATDANGDATAIASNNYNVGLVDENTDVIYGPNFTNIGSNEDRTIDQLMQRKFTLQPSLRLLNKGNNTLYNDEVVKDAAYNNDATIYSMAWVTNTDKDAGSMPRKSATAIDLGAYEYQQALYRILYVDPNKTETGNGLSWESPLGYGKIQDAIDLAGVYYVNSASEKGVENAEQAYVFVKGASVTNKGMHTGEALTFRNGVTVFGCLPASFNDVCGTTHFNDPERDEVTNANITEFMERVKAQREGVASHNTALTTIRGIYTNGTGFTNGKPAVLDGFDVTAMMSAGNPTGKITSPVIDVAPYSGSNTDPDGGLSLCLRNIIVHDNDASGTATLNVARVKNALMYEVLMRDNKVANDGAVLAVDKHAYVVNSTIEGKTKVADQTSGAWSDAPLNGGVNADDEATSRIHASLVNYDSDAATWKTLSGYSYPVEYKNLNYQLTEKSKHIDEIDQTTDGYNPQKYLPESLRQFVNYTTDHDILGNPRVLLNVTDQNKMDRGAFETWKVEKDFVCGFAGTNSSHVLKKSFYPHDGSVVYIMENKSLVIDPTDEYENKPTPHNPGFMLLQKGASCYGNGRPMTCSYLAVERSLMDEGNVVSLPFAMNYKANTAEPSYDSDGVLSLATDGGAVYTYDGSARADWKYDFRNANSPCWVENNGTVAANEGVLYDPTAARGIVRFTAKGTSMTDYIYTETTDAFKTVTLTQYNHGNVNTGSNADFTDADDMGWNAIGLPYLVSDYKPYTETTEAVHGASANGKQWLHIPHTLWLYYDGTTSPDGNTVNGDGGFYSVDSWENTAAAWHVGTDAEARIWVGEGFFTQTATLGDSETLTFYRPVYTAPVASPAKPMTRYYVTDGIRDIEKDSNGDAYIIDTQYFGTDGIQLEKPRRGVTIVRDIYSDGTTRSHKIHRK